MNERSATIKQQIIAAFEQEFSFIIEKFEVIDLLLDNSPMDYKVIHSLKLPSETNNIVWHPGVYAFIGNNLLYRVGVSMINSRARVMQHLEASTRQGEYGIWDIQRFPDKSILLFNVKNQADKHWLLSLEAFLEIKFQPKIRAGRIG